MTRLLIGSVLAALVAFASTAAAEDKAAAAAAFSEGKRLMAAGNPAEACPKFQFSYDQDRQLGTLLNLADCHEKVGKLATAWAEFGEALELARSKRDSRETFARQRHSRLAERISYLTIRKSKSDDIKVLLDDRDVTALANVSFPVDPGEHTLTVDEDGAASDRTFLIEHDSTRITIDVPFDEESASEPQDPQREKKRAKVEIDHTQHPVVVAPSTPPQVPGPKGHATRRTLGLVLGAVGVVGIGIGSYFGVRAIQKWGDSRDLCNSDGRCTADGFALTRSAHDAATLSNVFVGSGVALAALGTVLWLTSPKPATLTALPYVSPTGAGAAVSLRF